MLAPLAIAARDLLLGELVHHQVDRPERDVLDPRVVEPESYRFRIEPYEYIARQAFTQPARSASRDMRAGS